MHSDRDMTRLVRTWLRTDEHESADRLLADVLVLVETTTQNRSPRLVRRFAEASRAARLGIAAAAMLVVAVVATSVMPWFDGRIGPISSSSPSSVPSPRATIDPGTEYAEIEAGAYDVSWRQWRFRVTMPEGWLSAEAGWSHCGPGSCWPPQGGATITPYGLDGGSPDLTLDLGHDVVAVVEDVCASQSSREVPVGPTVDDLVTALENLEGVGRTGPTDVTLGGYPAKRFVLTLPAPGQAGCPGPEGHDVWSNATTYGFSILEDGTATVYVIDVDGERLVITSVERGASADHLAELDAIVASMAIERDPSPAPATSFLPQVELEVGRHTFTVAGVPVSVEVSTREPGNTGWSSNGAFVLSKSIVGPQGAEAALLWTSYPDPGYPTPCDDVLGGQVAASAADLAAAVAQALTDPVGLTGPEDVTLGGRPAQHVAFTVGSDTGCQPGVFWTWPDIYGGALWGVTRPGDTIHVWIVEVDGVLLFIEAQILKEATPALEGELAMFVDSIVFE